MTGCGKEEYDNAYYMKMQTVILVPERSETTNAQARPQARYKLQAAQGYLGGGSMVPETKFLEFKALYPKMDYFRPELRALWYEKNANGKWGPEADDVLRIFVTYRDSGGNDEVKETFNFIEKQLQQKQLEAATVPSRELAQRIPGLHFYRSAKNSDWFYYAFTSADGRKVVVTCKLGCTGYTTWQNKLRIRYQFPENRLSEISEIDLAVNRLIDSFQPTLIEGK